MSLGDDSLGNAHSRKTSSVSTSDVATSATDDDKNEDAVFYQVVMKHLRRLDAESRSLAALQIMKILHDAEFNSAALYVPIVPGVFRNAKLTTDNSGVEDVNLFKTLIRRTFQRLSVQRRDRAKYKITMLSKSNVFRSDHCGVCRFVLYVFLAVNLDPPPKKKNSLVLKNSKMRT